MTRIRTVSSNGQMWRLKHKFHSLGYYYSHNLFFHQNYAVYLMGIQVTVVFAKMGLSCIISNNLYFFVTIINDEKEKEDPLLSKCFIVFMSLDSTVCNSFFHKVLLQLLLKYD